MKVNCFVSLLLLLPPVFAQLHFASLGNWGTGGAAQSSVAATLKAKVREATATFLLSPGSNFVTTPGIESLDDPRWTQIFETPYKGNELHMPFFTVLGSQDWNGNFTALALRNNLTYTDEKVDVPKWTLPNWWYHYILHFRDASSSTAAFAGNDVSVAFVFIDTWILSEDFIYANITKLAWDDLQKTLKTVAKIFDWVIVVGDKAIHSSGASKGNSFLAKTLRPLLKEYGVDAYISGQDNDLEILEDGPLTLINCGSGGSGDSVPLRVKHEQSVAFTPNAGFCMHTLSDKLFTTHLVDGTTAKVVESYSQQKKRRERSYFDRFHLYKSLPEVRYIPVPDFLTAPIPVEDPFIKIIGTLGLCIMSLLVIISTATLLHRYGK